MKKQIQQSGFTLIEVLVAMIVLSIAIVTIMQLFSSNLKSLPSSELYSQAVFYARAKMEEVLSSDDFTPDSSSGSFDDTFSWVVNIKKEEPEKLEEDSSKPEKKEDPSIFDVFRIDLEVIWSNGDKEKSYTLSTLKSVVK